MRPTVGIWSSALSYSSKRERDSRRLGLIQLNYLGFEVSDVDAWRKLCVDVIGQMDVGEKEDGSGAFRMDDRAETSGSGLES